MKLPIALILAIALPGHAFSAEPASTEPAAPAAPDVSFDEFLLFEETDIIEVYDPLESMNRGIFWFNDKVYFYAMKPVARVFRVIPEDLRVAIRHFFINLEAPVRIVNAGLQGKFRIAGNELTRFVTNSTLGIGGLFDPARDHFNLRLHDEDTGQTLGHYGVGPGPFLVLPLLGPSNLRDGIGGFADSWLDLTWHLWGRDAGDDNYDYLGARTVDAVNDLSLDKDTYETVKQDALDPYLFIRDAHAQLRRNLVKN